MKFILNIIFPYSIFFSGIIGIARFHLVQIKYKPFLYLLWIGMLSEVLGTVFYLGMYVQPAYAKSNIYIFLEYAFYLWFFKNVLQRRKKTHLTFLFFLGVAIWIFENIIQGKLLTGYDFYCEIVYSLTLSLLAIEGINEVLLKEKTNLLKNSIFMITAGMVIFFTFSIFVETELHFAGVEHKAFFIAIFTIQEWINCFVNLVFAFAVLWIPTKKNFTNPSF